MSDADSTPGTPPQTPGRAEDDDGDERPRLTPAKKLAFAAVACVMVVAGLELVGRLAGMPSGAMRTLSKLGPADQQTFEGSVGMWQPGFEGRITWPIEVAYDVSINQLGFRGDEVTREKTPGVTRILCIGDSTTFGSHVDDADTYPARLQAQLRARGAKVEVINGGHPAWSISDEHRFLVERALVMKPDIILLLFCDNDPPGLETLDGSRGPYARKLKEIREGRSFADALRFHSALGEMETRLAIAIKMARNKQREHHLAPAAISDQQWSRYGESFGAFVETCRAAKIPVVVAAFPQIQESEDVAQRAETRVATIARSFKVPFVSVAPRFRKAEAEGAKLYNLPADTHANAKGNAIIAQAFAEALVAKKLVPFGR